MKRHVRRSKPRSIPRTLILISYVALPTLASVGCGEVNQEESRVQPLAAGESPAPRPPEALANDERALAPMEPRRPRTNIPRVDDDKFPVDREHLGRLGLLSPAQATGKLPKLETKDPGSARLGVANTERAPADLADRYRRYSEQWTALEADPGLTAEEKANRRAALKTAIVDQGSR